MKNLTPSSNVLVPRRAVLGVRGVAVEDRVVVALGSNAPELTNQKTD